MITREFLTFNVSNICSVPETLCKGISQCNRCKNNTSHSFECGSSHCSKNNQTCRLFLAIKQEILKAILSPVMIDPNKFKLVTTLKDIKECNFTIEENVCLKPHKCYYRVRKTFGEVFSRPIICPCPDNYTFSCAGNYCAKVESLCNNFNNETVPKCNYW